MTSKGFSLINLLIVDDELMVRGQISHYFAPKGFVVHTAENGIEGLAKMKSIPNIDIILLDLNMPEMNGIQFLEKLRETFPAKHIPPILMLTAERSDEILAKGEQLGVTYWAVKPISMPALEGFVGEILEETK